MIQTSVGIGCAKCTRWRELNLQKAEISSRKWARPVFTGPKYRGLATQNQFPDRCASAVAPLLYLQDAQKQFPECARSAPLRAGSPYRDSATRRLHEPVRKRAPGLTAVPGCDVPAGRQT